MYPPGPKTSALQGSGWQSWIPSSQEADTGAKGQLWTGQAGSVPGLQETGLLSLLIKSSEPREGVSSKGELICRESSTLLPWDLCGYCVRGSRAWFLRVWDLMSGCLRSNRQPVFS